MKPLQACRIFLKTHETHQKQPVARTALLASACSKKGSSTSCTCTKRKEKQTAAQLAEKGEEREAALYMCAQGNGGVFPPEFPMPCPLLSHGSL